MNQPSGNNDSPQVDRRTLLAAGGVALAGLVATPLIRRAIAPTASVFVARNQRYDGPLAETIRDGLVASGVDLQSLRGKRVLLKPNMVEPNRAIPHMTTHPAMIVATAEAFRRCGAQVTVGEAPGHVRDTELALEESGVAEALASEKITFADLNYEQVGWQVNRGGWSQLKGFYFPKSLLEADLIVSMPKMKTHHWVGFTASMKNCYGVLPGIQYGWPKNVLHHNGIPQTAVDICASLPPSLAVIDGIECMEGDGPILGSMKPMGLVVVGANMTATDATVARIMGLVPERVKYLSLAANHLGPIAESLIEQRGEAWREVESHFKVLDETHLRRLQIDKQGPLVT